MALLGTRQIYAAENTICELVLAVKQVGTEKFDCNRITRDMEFEYNLGKYRQTLTLTTQEFHFSTSLMPWSCRIPIGEGFYEFL